MKKGLIGAAVVLGVLVLAILIVPSMIDWNSYKSEIRAQVKDAIGRDLNLDGNVKVQILPSPSLSVSGVRLANIEGGSDPEMVRLDGLEVKVAIAPLLSGRVQVTTVRLIHPVILLEKTADGRANWEFAAAAAPEPHATPAAPSSDEAAAAAGGPPDIAVENFRIEDGSIIYTDATTGAFEEVIGINGDFAAASLVGPFETTGQFTYKNIDFAYTANVEEVIEGRTVPVTLELGIGPDAKFKLDGGIVNLEKAPKLRGLLDADGQDLRNLIAGLGGPADLPGMLGQKFGLQGQIEADATGVSTEALTITLGDSNAAVDLSVALGDTIDAQVNVVADKIDLDAWLADAPDTPSASARNDTEAKGTSTTPPSSAPSAPTGTADVTAAPTSTPALPTNIRAAAAVRVNEVTFKGQAINKATISVDLAEGEIVLNQISAGLPGQGEIAAFGFVTMGQNGIGFDGELEARAPNLRELMAWLEVTLPPTIPNDQLRNLALQAQVNASPAQVGLTGLNMKLDASTLTGAATVALGLRLGIGADLKLDTFNADPFLGGAADTSTPNTGGAGATSGGVAASGSDAASPGETPNPFTALRPLADFDADLKFTIGAVQALGATAKDVRIDALLQNGTLTLRNVGTANFAGLSAKLTGAVKDLGGIPKAEKLRVVANAKSVATLAKTLNAPLPLTPKQIGAVSADATLNGSLLTPEVNAVIGALGGKLSVSGEATPLSLLTGLDFNVSASHGDTVSLLRRLDIPYSPQGKIGGFTVSGIVSGSADKPEVRDLSAKIGQLVLQGAAQADLSGAVPIIVADLKGGELNLDPFLPAQKGAAIWDITKRHAALSKRWDRTPIDASALGLLNGDLRLTSPAITLQGITLGNADIAALIKDGQAAVETLKGKLWGGAIDVQAQTDTALRTSVAGTFNNLNLGAAVAQFGSGGLAGQVSGNLSLTAQGPSPAALVQSLTGQINLAARGMNVKELSRLGPAAPFAGIITVLNQVGGALGGRKQGQGLADLNAELDIQQGVVRPTRMEFISNIGEAQATGAIDLPAWTADIEGVVKPSANLLSALVLRNSTGTNQIGFSVSGSLDAPRTRIDSAALGGTSGVPIPGADQLLGDSDAGRAIGGILGGILGGGQQPPPQQQSQPQQQQQPQQQPKQPQGQQPTDPAQLLQQLFR